MTYTVKQARSGLTAIAAVLALSSTPLLAQETTAPPDPVAETVADPAPAADPVAPTTPELTQTETSAETAPAETAAPATTTRRTATRTKTTTTSTRRASTQPANTAAPAAAPLAIEAMAPPVPPPTGAMVDPGAMPIDETATETTAKPADDALPIAGAAGLGLLALGGIGMAIGRRRQKKAELAHQKANRDYLASHPDTPESHAPVAFASTAVPAMAGNGVGRPLKGAPRTKLPPNFDLSRFGPHTRAAYMGPTEDNPSLSMKHRLRRAAAMDQQARQHGEAPREAAHVAARPDQEKKPMWNVRNDGFMLRRVEGEQRSKHAYQR